MSLRKKIIISISSILLFLILLFLGYFLYVWFQYYRIEDNKEILIENNQTSLVETNKTYTLTTFNIGFGAYNQEYSFFLDKGIMKDGTKKVGKYAKATSFKQADINTNGVINAIKTINPDFSFFQEVDLKANRSYKINQYEKIKASFPNHTSIFTNNFHTAYLLYPLNDFMGKAESGIVTLSKYKIDSSTRIQLPLSDSKFSNLFDLDRCFNVSRTKINNDKDLVLVNIHMSAYDEGGKVRLAQLEVLNKFLEKEKNNYVIVGGDFNHILSEPEEPFKTEQLTPPWVKTFNQSALNKNYKIITGNNAPTCRGCDIPYVKDYTYTCIVDGFIINQNIDVEKVEVIDLDFLNSDHNPVKLTFKLK